MDSPDSMGHLAGQAAHGMFQEFLKGKKKSLQQYILSHKLGLVPEGLDYSSYNKIRSKNSFKQLQFLIGKRHNTLGIVLLGMHLATFSYHERSECIEQHKQEVYDKHGPEGVSVLNMALTGFIDVYIKWLTDYNVEKNPSRRELVDIYKDILREWKNITIFVQKQKADTTVRKIFETKMSSEMPFIYVFASASAIPKWKKILEACKIDKTLDEFDYHYQKYNLHGSEFERVWIFEHSKKIQ